MPISSLLANGKVMLPEAVSLKLTDAAGATRELRFFDRCYAGVAGRIDDFTVALRSHSIYVLRLGLNQFSNPATGDSLRLPAGRYRIAARFEGQGAHAQNLDMPGVSLLNFWKGTVESNGVELDVPAQGAAK